MLIALLTVTPALSAVVPATSADPAAADKAIEGRWIGTVRAPNDEIEFGIEIVRTPEGGLKARVFEPVLNLFGVPARIVREGATYSIPDAPATLAPQADRLELSFGPLKLPASLHRTAALPVAERVPKAPAGPKPLWKSNLGGEIYATAALDADTAYVGTTAGAFNAVRISDGSIRWAFSAGRPVYGEALVSGEAVFFVCDNGFLFKLDRSTGREIWRYDLGDAQVPRVVAHQRIGDWDSAAPRPTLDGGALYVGSGDGSVHAIDEKTGTRRWRFATNGKVRATALVSGGTVFVGSVDGFLYALQQTSGTVIWKQDTGGPVTSAPALVDGKVIVGNRGVGLLALDPETGAVVWRAPFWGSWVESTPAPYGGFFYIGSSDLRRIACYQPGDGRVVWRTDVGGWSWGRPVVTDDRVYVGMAGGSPYPIHHTASLAALDRATGKILWRWMPPPEDRYQWGFAAGPALGSNVLVIGGLNGDLYGFPAR